MSILFGILAIVSGLILIWVLGIIGIIITVVFAALAVFFGIKKKKEGNGGTGSIVCAILGIVFALIMFRALASGTKAFKDTIKDNPGKYDLIEDNIDDLKTYGFFGWAMKLSKKSELDQDKLQEQMDELVKEVTSTFTGSSSSTSSSSAK